MKEFLSAAPHVSVRSEVDTFKLPEIRIPLLYLFFASVWMVTADLLLSRATLSPGPSLVLHVVKCLNFVITTAALLYFVLRHAYGGWRLAEQRRLAVIQQARERYRMLCSRIQDLREEDRIRIARDIHDELGQLLTGIKFEVRMVEDHLAEREDRSLNPTIDQLVAISEMVDTTIESVQRVAADLRPIALENQELGTALLDEAEHFTQRTGIPCATVIEDLPHPLSPEMTTTAFRIFQEALTNVARHAEAQRVSAELSVEGNVLTLVVSDDGKGFDPTILEKSTSLGLVGMQERAENVGGKVTFSRNRNNGTDVVLTVPMPARNLPPPQIEPNLLQ